MWRTPILLILSLCCCFGLGEANLTDLLKLRANSKSVIIPFKNSLANKYIFRAEERSYHLYITFDAAEENACPYCVKLKQQLTFVATAYNQTLSKNEDKTPIFFISVNPKTANELYAQFQVQSLPLLGLVPAGKGEEITLQTFPLTSLECLTEPYHLVDWIAETSNVRVAIPLPLLRRPEVQYTAIGLVVLLVLYLLPILLRNYNHPMVGFALFMVVYVVVMNGTVWNAIHEPPFWGGAGKLFMPGMQSQFKVEGGIMGTMFVTAMTLWLLLTNWAPYTYRYLRWPAVLFCLTALAFVLNTIFRIFSHRKMGGGYPFYFDLPAFLA